MKNTLTRAGAIGMAAATIFTGLSFGPAAASAADATVHNTDPSRLVGKLLLGTQGAGYYTVDEPISGEARATYHGSLAAATSSNAPEWLMPGATATGEIRLVGSTICAEAKVGALDTPYSFATCDGSDAQQFHWAQHNNYYGSPSDVLESSATPGVYMHIRAGGYVTRYESSQANDMALASLQAAFSATVSDVSIPGRSAKLSGIAGPGSSIVVNNDQQVEADARGDWSATLTGLTLGVNTITLEQYEGTDKTDETSIEVDLAVQPVVATTTFPTDHSQNAVTSGTAHPGADVVITDADGTEIARTTASTNANGAWSVEVPAPNLGGDYPVTIHQEIDGESNGEISETIAYGSGIDITMPVEDMAHDGGPVAMRGTGEPGARITVREQGHSTVIGDTPVLVNGTWTLRTANVDTRKHVLEATQTGKGNNVTTSTVTLNPEAVDPVAPVTVTSPGSGTEFEPNTFVRFTGTGESGGVVTLTPTNGLASVETEVDEFGNWAMDRYLGDGPYTFDVIQVARGERTSVDGLVLSPKRTAPIDQDFAVTSPTSGALVKDKMVTFTGTGAAGTTVRIHVTNFASADVTTTVGDNGTWSVSRYFGSGPYAMDITQEGRVPGAVRDFRLNQPAQDDSTTGPFVVTGPADGTTFTANTQVEFTGTGTTGATITATAPQGAPVTTQVKSDGTWSVKKFLGNGPYTFTLTSTLDGDTEIHAGTISLTPAP
jgi:hypothetical protein